MDESYEMLPIGDWGGRRLFRVAPKAGGGGAVLALAVERDEMEGWVVRACDMTVARARTEAGARAALRHVLSKAAAIGFGVNAGGAPP